MRSAGGLTASGRAAAFPHREQTVRDILEGREGAIPMPGEEIMRLALPPGRPRASHPLPDALWPGGQHGMGAGGLMVRLFNSAPREAACAPGGGNGGRQGFRP